MKTEDPAKFPIVQGTNQDSPTHDDIRSISEEVERLKQEGEFLRNRLAGVNRGAETAQSHLSDIESCVIGWKDSFREQELLVGQARQEFQQALTEERKKALQQTTIMIIEPEDTHWKCRARAQPGYISAGKAG